MRIGRSAAALTAAIVCSMTLAAGTAQADPVKCKRAVDKANGQYVAAIQKLIDKCKIGVITKGVPASLSACTIPAIDAGFAVGKVTAARTKAAATIAGACGGADKNCATTGDNDSLASINWAIGSCMNFEGTVSPQCNNAISNCGNISPCQTCIADKALEQLEDGLLYDRFDSANFVPAAEPQKTRNKCQVTIAKATGKFVQAKTKILDKCWDAKHNDPTNAKGFGDNVRCPDTAPDNKAVIAIQSAEQKKIAAICKACGAGGDADKNSVCDTPPGLALADIIAPADLPFDCPDVQVPPNGVHPAGENCNLITVTDLQSYINCIDCVAEFKVDCMTHAGQGDANGIPGDGNGGTTGIDYPQQCNVTPCGNGMLDAGEDCDPPGSTAQCAALGAGGALQTCSGTCKCNCPDKVTFRGDPLSANSDLDTGWTGIAHDNKVVSNGDITVHVDTCPSSPDDSRPCGTCNISGPIANPGADAGNLNDQRCRLDSSVKCTSNAQCPGGGNACVFWFGAPLPLSSGGVATCVTNEVIGTLTGTANVETGESASTLNLTSHVYTGVLTDKPCPKCTDAGGINDGVTGGTCTDGDHAGDPCDANSSSPIPAFGRTSLDCPPSSGANIANLPIALKNSTDPESRSLSAASPNCTAFGFTTLKCACDTCNNAAATPCSSNADCGAGICGGLRCLVDAPTPGTPCSSEGTGSDSACCTEPTCTSGTIGTCGRPGEPSKPNACSNGQCLSGGGPDDGACQVAPNDNLCSIEPFRSCSINNDCRPPSEGGTCGSCATGLQTCGVKRRECFFDLDTNPGPFGTITVNGMEDPPVADVSHPILASLFCIAPTGSSAVNAVAGLPGLGKLKLTGTAQGLP